MSGLDDVYSDDLVHHMPPLADLDKVRLRNYTTGFHQAFPTSPSRWMAGRRRGHDGAALALHGHLQRPSPLLVVPPTGRSTWGTGVLMAHWRDGRISALWHFGDWLGWLTAAGVVSPLNATSAG